MTKLFAQRRFVQSNIAKGHRRKALLASTTLAAAGLAMLMPTSAHAVDDYTTPTGEQVVGGSATFDRPDQGLLNVNQGTDRVVINWDSFNIGGKATTEFFQPNSGSLAVNRVVGNGADPTQILGTLRSNGRIMVLDKNGVLFGRDAVIDVGGIVASTGDVDTNAVMNGDNRLELSNFGNGSVINLGTINVADAGLAAFVAPYAVNDGVINAKMGRVSFGAGSKVTLDLYGDDLLNIAVNDKLADALLENSGAVNAEGGTVQMTAQAAKAAVDDVINMSGVVNVSSVTVKGGKIVLSGGGNGVVKVGGTLNASGQTGGGDVTVTGQNVYALDTAQVMADAYDNGNGGTVGLWGDRSATLLGRVSARGGLNGGNGGFVELSAGEAVGFAGLVDTTAASGETGTFLIDPQNINIGNYNPAVMTAQLLADIFLGGNLGLLTVDRQSLANTLYTTDVDLWAHNTINTTAPLDLSTATIQTGTIYGGLACFFGCPVYSQFITGNDLSLSAPTVNIAHNVTLGTGGLFVKDIAAGVSPLGLGLLPAPVGGIQVNTLNLNAQILTRNTVGGATTLAGASQLNGQAHTVNVQSNAAKINQAIHFAGGTLPGTGALINIAGGTYNETVAAYKKVNLQGSGQGITVIDPNSPGVYITADGVTVNNLSVSTGDNGILVDNADDATITNVTFTGQTNAGVLVYNGSQNALIGNNNFNLPGATTASVWIDGGSNHDVQSNTINGGTYGIVLINTGDNNDVVGNTVGFTTGTLNNGITIAGNTGTTNVGFNHVYNAGWDGINVQNGTGIVNVANNDIHNTTGASGIAFVNHSGDGIATENFIENSQRLGVYVGNSSGLEISNNVINNSGLIGTGPFQHAIFLEGSNNVTVSQNNILGARGDGINVGGNGLGAGLGGNFAATQSTGIVLFENAISQTGNNGGRGDGIDVWNAPGVLIDQNLVGFQEVAPNNFLSLATDTINGDGILVDASNNAVVQRNYVARTQSVPAIFDVGSGIHVKNSFGVVVGDDDSGTGFDDFIGQGNTIIDIDWDGVKLTGGGNTVVRDNNISMVDRVGIYAGNVATALIAKNTLLNANMALPGYGAISADWGSNLTIDDNDIDGSIAHGIYLNGTYAPTVSANTIDTVSGHGIYLNNSDGDAGNDADIVNNLIGYGTDGILSGDDTNIGGNGIFVVDTAYNNISGNKITNTALNGIFVDPSPFSHINYNTITDFGGSASGILLEDSNDSEILGNTITGNNASFQTGITVQNSDRVQVGSGHNGGVNRNSVTDTGTGINVTNSDDVTVDNNLLWNVSYGVYADNVGGTFGVYDNEIRAVGGHNNGAAGINVFNVGGIGNVVIGGGSGNWDAGSSEGNRVDGFLSGVSVTGANTVTVDNNRITNGENGINVDGAAGAISIVDNQLEAQGANRIDGTIGIGVYNSFGGTTIGGSGDTNTVDGYNTGVRVFNASNVNVLNNSIVDATNGVDANYVSTLTIDNNTIDAHNGNVRAILGFGINVDHSSNVVIGSGNFAGTEGNTIDDFYYGINVFNVNGVTIDGNDVGDTNFGVYASGVTGYLTVTDNAFDAFDGSISDAPGNTPGVDTAGIYVLNSDGVEVNIGAGSGTTGGGSSDGNRVDDFETGIYVAGGDDVTIDNNAVTDARDYGIRVSDVDAKIGFLGYFDGLNIVDNTVDGSYSGTEHGEGIHVDGSDNAQVGGDTDGNTVTNTDLGIHVVDSVSADVEYNTISNIDGTGVFVQNSDYADITENDITNVNGYGIHVNPSDYVDINGNDIYDTENDGIYVDQGEYVEIWDNNIDEVDDDGIHVYDNDNARIWDNRINTVYGSANTEDDGIYVVDSHNVDIFDNDIRKSDNNGIHLQNTDDVSVWDNTITTAYRGIYLPDSGTDGADIDDNTISRVQYGVYADDVADLNIEDNTIDGFTNPWDAVAGIYVTDSEDARIGGFNDGNTVTDFVTGIRVIDSESADIEYNDVSEFQDYGIRVSDSDWVDVKNNDVYDGNGTGIRVFSSNDAEINDNDINNVDGHGIELVDSHRVDIFRNEVTNVDQHGIFVDPSDFVDVAYNYINNAGWDGIHVLDGSYADIWDNDVYYSGDDGIDVNSNYGVEIWDNYVYSTGNHTGDGNGIEVSDSYDAYVGENEIWYAGDDGIDLTDSSYADIRNNDVYWSWDDGIYVDDAYAVDIVNNHVHGTYTGNGINVTDSYDADVIDNDVHYTDEDGIYADNIDYGDVRGNDVYATGDDGIDVRNSFRVDIVNNDTFDTDGDGIQVRNSAFADVNWNDVTDARDDGIDVENSDGADIRNNDIRFVRENGIEVSGSDYVEVTNNDVRFADDDGINVSFGRNILIDGNDVRFIGDDGIDVSFARNVTVSDNETAFTWGDGVQARYVRGLDIVGNDVERAGDDGIDVENSHDVTINGNEVDYVINNGIEVSGSSNVGIDGNDVGLNGYVFDNGIDVRDVDGVTISNNNVGTNVWDNGIYVNPSNNVLISSNFIDGVGENGVKLVGNTDVTLLSNLITNSGARGLYAAGPDNGLIVLADNVFTNNPVGAEFESGVIDLTGAANTFNGGDTALLFSPYDFGGGLFAPMSLVNDTIGETFFNGQSSYYVYLDNGAFFAPGNPTRLNGLNATYDGFRPANVGGILTQAQYDAIEAMIFHFNDLNSLGLFFFGEVPLDSIDQERVYNTFGNFTGPTGRLNVTLRGLPSIPGLTNAAFTLSAIEPAAGEEEGEGTQGTAGLAGIEPAAGDVAGGTAETGTTASGTEDTYCWGDAVNAAGGGATVNMSYGTSPEEALSAAAACQSGI